MIVRGREGKPLAADFIGPAHTPGTGDRRCGKDAAIRLFFGRSE